MMIIVMILSIYNTDQFVIVFYDAVVFLLVHVSIPMVHLAFLVLSPIDLAVTGK